MNNNSQNKNRNKKKRTIGFSISIVLFFFFVIFCLTGVALASSSMTVESTHDSLNPGEESTISILLNPDTLVKSYEFSIIFDKTHLKVNASSAAHGDFFDEVNDNTPFSSNGTIDNNNGMITDIYSLIVGDGMVSTEGTLYSFTVEALSPIQDTTTWINLSNAGITNETMYLPLETQNRSLLIHTIYGGSIASNPVPGNQSTGISIDTSSLQIYLFHSNGLPFDYSVSTSPPIGSASGTLLENTTLSIPISGLVYETSYEWTIALDDGMNSAFFSFTFTTEDTPDDDNDNDNDQGSPPNGGGGGGYFPPPPAEPEEEEVNHPPEAPLPPQGFAYVEPGISHTYTVSSWDRDDDGIRFQMDWGNGSYSEWSTYVPSNETVEFTIVFTEITSYDIRVRAQDEQGLNSSWSQSYTVIVSAVEEPIGDTRDLEISAVVNSETGEASFHLEGVIYSFNGSIVWDFGDGTVIAGESPQHQYTSPGTYLVTVTITDEDGSVTMESFIVRVPGPQKDISTSRGESSFPWLIVFVGMGIIFVVISILRKRIFYFLFEKVNDDKCDGSNDDSSYLGKITHDQEKTGKPQSQSCDLDSLQDDSTIYGNLPADSSDPLVHDGEEDRSIANNCDTRKEVIETESVINDIHKIREFIDNKDL